ncbi:MAG: DUF881 domain-containing protein [Selenomonadaceae bacterium]|nr:DUF881 domain-containing protein [Selenomonadaceae bacterium]
MNKNNWLAVLLSVTLSLCATTMMVQLKFSEPTPTVIERAVPNPIAISDDVEELRLMAGLTALEGQGVTVEMDDSVNSAKAGENPNLYVIHDDDVLRVINELRAAGAEAIAINGQRLIETSEIRCAGPTLSVNNVRSAAPFIISAIGDKVALENSIKMRGGVEQTLKVWGIKIEVKAADDIYIPPFKGNRSYKYAQPTAEKIVGREK